MVIYIGIQNNVIGLLKILTFNLTIFASLQSNSKNCIHKYFYKEKTVDSVVLISFKFSKISLIITYGYITTVNVMPSFG